MDLSQPMSSTKIEDIHSTIMKFSSLAREDIGRIRTKQNFIGSQDMSLISCVFPPPPEDVPALMEVIFFTFCEILCLWAFVESV